MSAIAAYWTELVTTALLGTDRREPPRPLPGLLADLEADQPRPTASQRLLQQVGACVVVRRAGVVPGEAAPPCAPPEPDARPVTSPAATATWRRVVADWPVLEDEWVLTVLGAGWRLAPELVVPLLGRHRTDPVRHARVTLAAGPIASWLAEWEPRLAVASRVRPTPEAVGSLPELAMVPELQALLGAPPAEVAASVAGGIHNGSLATAHRAMLVNFVARVQAPALVPLSVALDRTDPSRPAIGLAFALADLARLRHRMLADLEPT